MYSRIIGTGRYLPENIVTNHDLEQRVDTTDEWIRTRTGYRWWTSRARPWART